jgi:dTDP-4-amino-4,6-dideoxygalactose transaminase
MSSKPAILGGTPVRSTPFPAWPVHGAAEEQALLRVLHSGKWGKLEGPEVATFEKRFAEYHGAKHGIAVVNGTVSLRIALLAAGIQAGDEVIIPPYTFLATASAVVEANATPVFVDIDRETFNLDPGLIEQAITPSTRAIICVHVGGMSCDMDAIMAIAKKHNLIVIEDAAHAHGSEYSGRKVGGIGRMGSFSFQSSKNMTSGEGGIIVSNDEQLAARCRSIHNCGRVPGGKWYEHHVISGNYRLGEFAGAILNCQLDRLREQVELRDANGRYLDKKLSQIPGITPQRRDAFATRSSQHLYLFRFDEAVFGFDRARFLEALAKEGIPAAPGYVVPLYRQPLFANKAFGPYDAASSRDYANARLPVCEQISKSDGAWFYQAVLLGNQRDMDDVVDAMVKIYEHREHLRSAKPQAAGVGG